MLKVFIVVGLFIAQAPDDPEPGQPASCDNFLRTAPAHRCECGRAMQKCHGPEEPEDVRMDKRCKTYCRAQHCQCVGSGCSG